MSLNSPVLLSAFSSLEKWQESKAHKKQMRILIEILICAFTCHQECRCYWLKILVRMSTDLTSSWWLQVHHSLSLVQTLFALDVTSLCRIILMSEELHYCQSPRGYSTFLMSPALALLALSLFLIHLSERLTGNT